MVEAGRSERMFDWLTLLTKHPSMGLTPAICEMEAEFGKQESPSRRLSPWKHGQQQHPLEVGGAAKGHHLNYVVSTTAWG